MNDDERWDRAEAAVQRAEVAVMRAEAAVQRAESAVDDTSARHREDVRLLTSIRHYVIGKLALDLLIFIVLLGGWNALQEIGTHGDHRVTQHLVCELARHDGLNLPDCEGR